MRRPPRHPELQTLQQNIPWDSVLAVSIPPADSPAPAAAVAAAARANRQTNGIALPAKASEDSLNQTGEAQDSAESVLILGLRGQRLDLERYTYCVKNIQKATLLIAWTGLHGDCPQISVH